MLFIPDALSASQYGAPGLISFFFFFFFCRVLPRESVSNEVWLYVLGKPRAAGGDDIQLERVAGVTSSVAGAPVSNGAGIRLVSTTLSLGKSHSGRRSSCDLGACAHAAAVTAR